MRKVFLASLLATSCSSGMNASGTLVYSDQAQHIRLLDLANGRSSDLDSGTFGSLTIAPDGEHVAYQGIDRVFKVSDRSGNIVPLSPSGGDCVGPATWLSSTALEYCISDATREGSMILPALDGTPPRFVDGGVVASSDGALDTFVDSQNNVIVENIDGSGRRVLLPAPNPTTQRTRTAGPFTPDGRSVLVADFTAFPEHLYRVSLVDTSMVDLGALGGVPGPVFTNFLGASAFSVDGTELLMPTPTSVVAVSLATGAQRTILTLAANEYSGGAVFLDSDHILWIRVDDHSVGDLGNLALSLHVAGPGPNDDLVLDAPNASNNFWCTIAVSPRGFVALPSDVLIVTFDGHVVARNEPNTEDVMVEDILGMASDGASMITISYNGAVDLLSENGARQPLVQAPGSGDLPGPTAAYSPL